MKCYPPCHNVSMSPECDSLIVWHPGTQLMLGQHRQLVQRNLPKVPVTLARLPDDSKTNVTKIAESPHSALIRLQLSEFFKFEFFPYNREATSSRFQPNSKLNPSRLQADSCVHRARLGIVPCSNLNNLVFTLNSPRVRLELASCSPWARLVFALDSPCRSMFAEVDFSAECATLSSNARQMQGECTPTASRFLGVLQVA